jgi:peptidoglycan hydrolase CwlO-like protein
MNQVADEVGMALHDRFTRCEPLAPHEVKLLETWYAQQDATELLWLSPPSQALPSLEVLQQQVDESLEQLNSVAQRIQQVSQENDVLRQEISELHQQLTMPQSA